MTRKLLKNKTRITKQRNAVDPHERQLKQQETRQSHKIY